jgi:hypothetical protein
VGNWPDMKRLADANVGDKAVGQESRDPDLDLRLAAEATSGASRKCLRWKRRSPTLTDVPAVWFCSSIRVV